MSSKYKPYPKINLPDRTWPEASVTAAPIWCSVDLRDGNQALIKPMSLPEKIEFFQLLAEIGLKEIEVGFPSASQVEFDFCRQLIEENLIPEDVSLQVLVQAREALIKRTIEALQGADEPIVHMYNSTSVNQRKIVFKKDRSDIIAIAIQGIRWIKQYAAEKNMKVRLQYSPESFTGTELDYALEICNAVIEEWGPTPDNKIIINLPATMELSLPNIYADMVEWMSRQLVQRENVILSIHTHNDRGTCIAASELAMLAGAQRVEGTLMGNGERTGNADLVTLALNLFTQGIDPELDVFDTGRLVEQYERFTRLPVHPRHPYVGQLVYTAFSGSHQDAINKGLAYQDAKKDALWEVPYLPIDPTDVGRDYEGIIRINSQSGKGGVAYILKDSFGYELPKDMHPAMGRIIQQVADKQGTEISPDQVLQTFESSFVNIDTPLQLVQFDGQKADQKVYSCQATLLNRGQEIKVNGTGNGPVDAFKNALLKQQIVPGFTLQSYHEHAKEVGSQAQAVSYISIVTKNSTVPVFGVGLDTSITQAAIRALLSALNRC